MGKEKYSIAIIGAGNIAAGFDSPIDDHILTHAHAIKINDRLNCLGFFDVRTGAASEASIKWDFPVLHSFQELIDKKPDIVVICSPDSQHVIDLRNLLTSSSVSFIVCEKPLCTTFADSQEIVSLLHKKQVPLFVNYQRRYDPSVIKVKQDIDQGFLGRPVAPRRR